jgi:transcriptional regulator with XRE-family HTH domain
MKTINKKRARVYDSPLLASLLAEITPEEHERTVKQMMMSARIEDGMIAKGWSKGEFAKQMGQTPSTISKWLSGSHNFTLDTLTDIQRVLGIQLLCVKDEEPTKEEVVKVVYKTIFISPTFASNSKSYVPNSTNYQHWNNNQAMA